MCVTMNKPTSHLFLSESMYVSVIEITAQSSHSNTVSMSGNVNFHPKFLLFVFVDIQLDIRQCKLFLICQCSESISSQELSYAKSYVLSLSMFNLCMVFRSTEFQFPDCNKLFHQWLVCFAQTKIIIMIA